MRRKTRRLRVLSLVCVCASVSCGLSACTAALEPLEPAAPKSAPTEQPAPTSAAETELNPYATGVVKSWHVGLPSAPSFIAYEEKSRTFVVAIDRIGSVRSTQVKTFTSVGSDQVLEHWSVDLPQLSQITALAVAGDTIFVNGVGSSGSLDFLSINLSSGSVRNDWGRSATSGDAEENAGKVTTATAPRIVGMYTQGVGVMSSTPVSLTAQLLDGSGAAVNTADLPLDNGQLQASSREEQTGVSAGALAAAKVILAPHLVNTQLPAGKADALQTHVPMSVGTQFVSFPKLQVLEGDECFAVSDGFVCTVFAVDDVPEQTQDQEPAQGKKQVSPKSSENGLRDGSAESVGKGATGSDATGVHTISKDSTSKDSTDKTTTETDGRTSDPGVDDDNDVVAVVSEYNLNGHRVRQSVANSRSVAATTIPVSFHSAITTRELADALVGADTALVGTDQAAVAGNLLRDSRKKSMWYDGVWLERSQWKVPEGETLDGAQALQGMAPLYRLSSGAIVNAKTGKMLTSEGGIGYQGISAGAPMLFEFTNGELVYLVPAGAGRP